MSIGKRDNTAFYIPKRVKEIGCVTSSNYKGRNVTANHVLSKNIQCF